LLKESAQVVVRIGGTRLSGDELGSGLLKSLNASGYRFKMREARHTYIKNGQRRMFSSSVKECSVEHDFRFQMA
jgi:hypothetical protein